MSSWTNKDEAAGAPLWAVAYIKKTPSSANRTNLFEAVGSNFTKAHAHNGAPAAESALVCIDIVFSPFKLNYWYSLFKYVPLFIIKEISNLVF